MSAEMFSDKNKYIFIAGKKYIKNVHLNWNLQDYLNVEQAVSPAAESAEANQLINAI